jgi:hypothetical protein
MKTYQLRPATVRAFRFDAEFKAKMMALTPSHDDVVAYKDPEPPGRTLAFYYQKTNRLSVASADYKTEKNVPFGSWVVIHPKTGSRLVMSDAAFWETYQSIN